MIRAYLTSENRGRTKSMRWTPMRQKPALSVCPWPESLVEVSDDAWQWIVENARLVNWYAKKYRPLRAISFHDRVMLFLPDIVKALSLWKPDGGASKATYVGQCLLQRLKYRTKRMEFFPRRLVPGFNSIVAAPLLFGDLVPEVAEDEPRETDHVLLDQAVASLKVLPERLRDIVHKRFWLGMNLRDIGASIGVSHQRVDQLLYRALERMRDSMEGVVRVRRKRGRPRTREQVSRIDKLALILLRRAKPVATFRKAFTFMYGKSSRRIKKLLASPHGVDPGLLSELEWQMCRIRALVRSRKAA